MKKGVPGGVFEFKVLVYAYHMVMIMTAPIHILTVNGAILMTRTSV
jgi:hypothetical protein